MLKAFKTWSKGRKYEYRYRDKWDQLLAFWNEYFRWVSENKLGLGVSPLDPSTLLDLTQVGLEKVQVIE